MTAPVQEPSQGRTDQAQEWKTRQLFRRPAPPSATASYKNPVMAYDIDSNALLSLERYGLLDYYSVEDTTVPGGVYLTTEGGGSTGDSLIIGAPIGPKGSLWCFWMIYGTGPSGGRMQIEMQTQPESTTSPGLFLAPDTGGTWLNYYNYLDCYSAGFSWNNFDINDRIVPYGDDDAPLTANISAPNFPTSQYGSNYSTYDGGGDGSLIWYFRFRTLSTVNAGNVSGNKDMWIRHLRLTRFVGINTSPFPDDEGEVF